ncbi:bifunctional ADP-dependent (S)-NAD(P)H-hydrate dehydratase/NAD(P)H-hydrate epimerase [Acidovorax sp. SRB_14]|uniref:NAD(P)H-hydrate dehydratase n=1 Tax=Acidovorax sp. SRB_14 TaxID=1962699 RepID=UPI001564AAC7|nr:NAD(P)H-hydrate dehydratase [Acidovorax sp. SRB_14]NMM79876.1 bifunctional ADP-dependent (S)-NAD(P)H-hydrate dehydratase/NAD(P)H-hydrate epimerase [Acidovorax sp. SRB_14]
MHRITPGHARPLFGTAATQRIERLCATPLPAHTLMQRAGLAVAHLARALAPHARTVWIACGPGNNGGDGLEAAIHLHRHGLQVVVTCLGTPERAPEDARQAWQRARAAGVPFSDGAPAQLGQNDLCIDALLGLGLAPGDRRAAPDPQSPLLSVLRQLRRSAAPLLAVDLPSGLQADTGQYAPGFAADTPPDAVAPAARHTLSLLTLKPGLFTGAGRDAAGTVWFDDLACDPGGEPASAWLAGPPPAAARPHASHKGSYGDVAVVGGEGLQARGMGMSGAALLAGRAALHSGAGRVLLAPLDAGRLELDPQQPELMLRHFGVLPLEHLTVVCGCGGGEAVRAVLAPVLARAPRLVLDADALNAVAADTALQEALGARAQRGQSTVLTPHPLEAARLLGQETAEVQAHRLAAAQRLAERFACAVVLKGSGTVVAAPGRAPHINPTGNARLATAGTGDVLAGMVGAGLAGGASAPQAAVAAVFAHGLAADQWPAEQALTASRLAVHGMGFE